jgi:hypothetical protein
MKVSTLKKVIKKPTVTLLHALQFALQQNEQIYLHGGFGNSMVLEKTGGDMDAVVPVIARFHKNQGPIQMKLGAVYRTDVATLFESSSIYDCKLTMAEKDDVDLKYMISGLVVEYDPIDADRRSPSPKRKAEGEGNGARDSEFVIADRIVWCSAERGRVDPTGQTDRLHGSESQVKLTVPSAHCEPLFAQLTGINKQYLRLKYIISITQNKDGDHSSGALITCSRAKSRHLAVKIRIKGEHLFAETGVKGEHLFAETGIKGEHLFAETEIKGEHLFAETEIKGEHLFAETEIKGEHLFAETGIKGEHLLAETESKGEHLLAEIKNKGEHLLAEPTNVNRKQEREPVKTKRAGW